jgi:hypothetical protein
VRPLAVVALLAAFSPTPSSAREGSLSAELAYAFQYADSTARHGTLLGVRGYVGVRDILMVGGALEGGIYPGAGGAYSAFPAASVLFKVDVIEWVPALSLDVGPIFRWLPEQAGVGVDLDVAVGIGVDYLISRDWAIGAGVRYHVIATDVRRTPGALSVGVRAVFRWE